MMPRIAYKASGSMLTRSIAGFFWAACFLHALGSSAADIQKKDTGIPRNIAEIQLGDTLDSLKERAHLAAVDFNDTPPVIYEYSPGSESGYSRIRIHLTPASQKVYMISAGYQTRDVQFTDLAKVYKNRLGKPSEIKEKCELPNLEWGDMCHVWRNGTTVLYVASFGPQLYILDRALLKSGLSEAKKAAVDEEHAREKRAASAIP